MKHLLKLANLTEDIPGEKSSYGLDLRNMRSIPGYDKNNRWYADVESVLIDYDNNDVALLTKNCVTQNVHAGKKIFDGKCSTIRIIATTSGNFTLRVGSGIIHPFRSVLSDKIRYSAYSSPVKVFYKIARWEPMSFSEVLEHVQYEKNLNDDLFMAFDYEYDRRRYRVLTKCRYLNFPNPQHTEHRNKYLQPICGDVVVKIGAHFRIAYIASRTFEDSVERTEIISNERVDYFFAKRGFLSDRGRKLMSFLFYPLGKIFKVDEYCLRTEVDADISFFRLTDYDNKDNAVSTLVLE